MQDGLGTMIIKVDIEERRRLRAALILEGLTTQKFFDRAIKEKLGEWHWYHDDTLTAPALETVGVDDDEEKQT